MVRSIGFSYDGRMKGAPGIGFIDKQSAFFKRHRLFFEGFGRLVSAIDAAFDRTLYADSPLDPAIFYLGMRTIDDFQAILILCANDLGLPAQATIRSMYERVVTAAHLHANPDDAQDFADFEIIERRRAAQEFKATAGIPEELEQPFAELEDEYEEIKGRFEIERRDGKKSRVRSRWSDQGFVDLARKQERLSLLLVPAYYLPLQQAHSTMRSAAAVLRRDGESLKLRHDYSELCDETFRLGHLLVLHALAVQVEHFPAVNIEPALELAMADYLEMYPGDSAIPQEPGA